MITAILLAAGPSASPVESETWCLKRLNGICALQKVDDVFRGHGKIGFVLFVLPKDLIDTDEPQIRDDFGAILGRASKFESTLEALRACPASTQRVIIHDANKPRLTEGRITDVINGLYEAPAVVSLIRSKESVVWFPPEGMKRILDRKEAFSLQMPQAFTYRRIVEAYETCDSRGKRPSEPIQVWDEAFGLGDVLAVPGNPENVSINSKETLEAFCGPPTESEEDEILAFEDFTGVI